MTPMCENMVGKDYFKKVINYILKFIIMKIK